MKKFSFKLNGLLKLREFEEYVERVKLGKVNRRIKNILNKLDELERSSIKLFERQEKDLISG